MATAQLLADNDTLEAEIFIAAPPARVYEAVTDPKQTRQWWGAKGLYSLTETKADLRIGGKWSTEGMGSDGKTFRVEGEYLELDPPRLVVYSWIPSFAGNLNTTVRVELVPKEVHGIHAQSTHRVGTGTLVKVRHSGFAGNIEAAQGHRQGWMRVLGWMQAYVERGETYETRPDP